MVDWYNPNPPNLASPRCKSNGYGNKICCKNSKLGGGSRCGYPKRRRIESGLLPAGFSTGLFHAFRCKFLQPPPLPLSSVASSTGPTSHWWLVVADAWTISRCTISFSSWILAFFCLPLLFNGLIPALWVHEHDSKIIQQSSWMASHIIYHCLKIFVYHLMLLSIH